MMKKTGAHKAQSGRLNKTKFGRGPCCSTLGQYWQQWARSRHPDFRADSYVPDKVNCETKQWGDFCSEHPCTSSQCEGYYTPLGRRNFEAAGSSVACVACKFDGYEAECLEQDRCTFPGTIIRGNRPCRATSMGRCAWGGDGGAIARPSQPSYGYDPSPQSNMGWGGTRNFVDAGGGMGMFRGPGSDDLPLPGRAASDDFDPAFPLRGLLGGYDDY